MLGFKEWLFVAIQVLFISLIILSTYTILDGLSDALAKRRMRKMEKKILAKFNADVKSYQEKYGKNH